MVVLALVWWAWSAFVWAANAQEATRRRCGRPAGRARADLRRRAGGAARLRARGTLFAVTYAGVRFLHLGGLRRRLAPRQRRAERDRRLRRHRRRSAWRCCSRGVPRHGLARVALWAAAVAIDYAGPGVADPRAAARAAAGGRGPFRRALRRVRDHLPRRVDHRRRRRARAPSRLDARPGRRARWPGSSIAVGLWWTYFDRVAEAAEGRLRVHDDPVLAAADAYSYMHLVMVAGDHRVRRRRQAGRSPPGLGPCPTPGGSPCAAAWRSTCAGLAAFRLRMLGEHSFGRLLVARRAAGALRRAACCRRGHRRRDRRAHGRAVRRRGILAQARGGPQAPVAAGLAIARAGRGLTSGVSVRSNCGRRCSYACAAAEPTRQVVGILVDGEPGGEGRGSRRGSARGSRK